MTQKPPNRYMYYPIIDSNRSSAKEGDAVFHANGTVVLLDRAFAWNVPIDHTFSGCKAVRGNDGFLVITTLAGSVYKYRYLEISRMWFRVVEVEENPSVLGEWLAEAKECTSWYGLFLGLAIFAIRFVILRVVCSLLGITLYAYVSFYIVTMECSPPKRPFSVTLAEDPVRYAWGLFITWLSLFVTLLYRFASHNGKLGIYGWFWAISRSLLLLIWPVLLTGGTDQIALLLIQLGVIK